MIRRQDHNRQFAMREVLSAADVLVAGDRDIKPSLFGCIEQCSIFETAPPHFACPRHLVPPERSGQSGWSIHIEQDLHAAATGCSREAFAKFSTSCTCCALTTGNHSRNSSIVEPLSRCSKRESTARRVPAKHQVPPSFLGFRSTAVHKAQFMIPVYRMTTIIWRRQARFRYPCGRHPAPGRGRPHEL